MKKIYVMIGNYGSGKSELALNFAFKAAETGKTELIDLDLVNTYFRLTERGKLVEQKEIIMKRDWESYIHSLSEKKQA